MGKVFYIFKKTKVNSPERYCKNCGKLLKRRPLEDGCCCKSCSLEYALKWKDEEKLVGGFDALPYNTYTSNPLRNYYRRFTNGDI